MGSLANQVPQRGSGTVAACDRADIRVVVPAESAPDELGIVAEGRGEPATDDHDTDALGSGLPERQCAADCVLAPVVQVSSSTRTWRPCST